MKKSIIWIFIISILLTSCTKNLYRFHSTFYKVLPVEQGYGLFWINDMGTPFRLEDEIDLHWYHFSGGLDGGTVFKTKKKAWHGAHDHWKQVVDDRKQSAEAVKRIVSLPWPASMYQDERSSGTILNARGLMRCMCVEWAIEGIMDDSTRWYIEYNNTRMSRPKSNRFFLSKERDLIYYDGEPYEVTKLEKPNKNNTPW